MIYYSKVFPRITHWVILQKKDIKRSSITVYYHVIPIQWTMNTQQDDSFSIGPWTPQVKLNSLSMISFDFSSPCSFSLFYGQRPGRPESGFPGSGLRIPPLRTKISPNHEGPCARARIYKQSAIIYKQSAMLDTNRKKSTFPPWRDPLQEAEDQTKGLWGAAALSLII